MAMEKRVEFRVPCEEPSRWVVSFSRENGAGPVEVGLHFGDKLLATHVALIDEQDFGNMLTELRL